MKIHNVTFYVKNISRSLDFYQKLGLTVIENQNNSASFMLDNSVLFSIVETQNQKRQPGQQVCAFSTQNVNGLYEKLKLLGTPIESALNDAPWGKNFTINDPDGNKVEIVEESSE